MAGTYPTYQIECAFFNRPGDPNPQWYDITDYVISWEIFRGRTYETDQVQPGTMTLVLDNTDRRFEPTLFGGPYYQGLLPRRRIRFSVTWNGTTYFLFTGFVDKWPQTYQGSQYTETTVTARDAFLPLGNALITGTFNQELSGSRISNVLAAAQWATSTPVSAGGYWTLGTSQLGVNNRLGYNVPLTVVDAGQKQVAAVTYATTDKQTALTHMQQVAASENGVVFIDGQGRVVFHDGMHRIRTTNASPTFDDDASHSAAGVVIYKDIVFGYDFEHGANEVIVSRPGGSDVTVTDTTSQSNFFRSSRTVSSLLASDHDQKDLAGLLLRQLKDPRGDASQTVPLPQMRVEQISVSPWVTNGVDQWAGVLAREISDRVFVIRTPWNAPTNPTGVIATHYYVEGIRHSGSDSSWETTLQFSPGYPAADFWILGTSRLGQTTVLAF